MALYLGPKYPNTGYLIHTQIYTHICMCVACMCISILFIVVRAIIMARTTAIRKHNHNHHRHRNYNHNHKNCEPSKNIFDVYSARMHVCTCVCMYVCMHACMYAFTYIHTDMYVHVCSIYTWRFMAGSKDLYSAL